MIDLPRQVGIALITEGPRVLVTQRRPGDSFPGYWEFPGGTREPGETLEECVVREMREELGVTVAVDGPGPEVVHRYPDLRTIRVAGARSLDLAPRVCWTFVTAPPEGAWRRVQAASG